LQQIIAFNFSIALMHGKWHSNWATLHLQFNQQQQIDVLPGKKSKKPYSRFQLKKTTGPAASGRSSYSTKLFLPWMGTVTELI